MTLCLMISASHCSRILKECQRKHIHSMNKNRILIVNRSALYSNYLNYVTVPLSPSHPFLSQSTTRTLKYIIKAGDPQKQSSAIASSRLTYSGIIGIVTWPLPTSWYMGFRDISVSTTCLANQDFVIHPCIIICETK